MTVGVAIIATLIIAATVMIVGSFAVGLVLVMYDEIVDRIEDGKARRYWKERAGELRKQNRNRRIEQLERELGITDNRRDT